MKETTLSSQLSCLNLCSPTSKIGTGHLPNGVFVKNEDEIMYLLEMHTVVNTECHLPPTSPAHHTHPGKLSLMSWMRLGSSVNLISCTRCLFFQYLDFFFSPTSVQCLANSRIPHFYCRARHVAQEFITKLNEWVKTFLILPRVHFPHS